MTSSRSPQPGRLPARLSLSPYAGILACAFLLGGCGGGSDPVAPTENAKASVRAAAANEGVGPNCAAGGARIDAGIDTNGNGVLDASEISSTQYVCNGAIGATGATGATGITGATGATGPSGSTMLVRMESEAAGTNCAAGGTKISAGLDTSGDGVLDTVEVSGTPTYVCGGVPGAAGANGINGATGATGATGAIGAAGAPGTPGATGATGRSVPPVLRAPTAPTAATAATARAA